MQTVRASNEHTMVAQVQHDGTRSIDKGVIHNNHHSSVAKFYATVGCVKCCTLSLPGRGKMGASAPAKSSTTVAQQAHAAHWGHREPGAGPAPLRRWVQSTNDAGTAEARLP